MEEKINKNNTKITYTKVGDYNIPNIVMPQESKETKGKDIGKYGRLRLNYLKENDRVLYQNLLLDNKLHEHLVRTNEETKMKINDLVKKLAKQENVDENLKANNQLEWVQQMNNIHNRAEEIILNETIYC